MRVGRVPLEVVAAVRAAIPRVGTDPDELAFALDLSPDLVRHALNPRYRKNSLSAAVVAELRGAFMDRRGVTVHDWCVAQGRRLGVGHATIRRAVYRFGSYAASPAPSEVA